MPSGARPSPPADIPWGGRPSLPSNMPLGDTTDAENRRPPSDIPHRPPNASAVAAASNAIETRSVLSMVTPPSSESDVLERLGRLAVEPCGGGVFPPGRREIA